MKEFFTSRFATIRDFLATQQFPTAEWKNVFTADFWTNDPLTSGSPYYTFGLVLTLLFLILLEVWRRRLKNLHVSTPIYEVAQNQLSNIFFFVAIMLPAYWFFRVQQLAYLSSRLLLGSIILVALVWLGWVVFHITRQLPAKRVAHLEKERFFRYLPTNATGATKAPRRKGK
ncbi:MAG: hypothetical protein HZB70_02265 [Candidatus Berkelbacteria bacterium]|nr:MAG: hypothetical protein HZB70_02265 [Candidatus Berkelbacteria bacterium]QQG51860.1 MAG: hypothetical protein HY845_00730 [Candidatus Berkelbacteria bacterium]